MDNDSIIASNTKWFLLLEDIDSTGTTDEMLRMTFNPFLKLEQRDRAPVFFYKEEWEVEVGFYTE